MEMPGKQAGADQAGAFRPWQKFWISFRVMGSLWEAYCRGLTGLISDLERSWAAEWSKGCRKQEWKLGNASGGLGRVLGADHPPWNGSGQVGEAMGGKQIRLVEGLWQILLKNKWTINPTVFKQKGQNSLFMPANVLPMCLIVQFLPFYRTMCTVS